MSEVPMKTRTDGTQTNLLKLVRYAARSAGIAASKRDAAIREAHRAGVSLRDIAAESDMSHMTVKRIIQRSSE